MTELTDGQEPWTDLLMTLSHRDFNFFIDDDIAVLLSDIAVLLSDIAALFENVDDVSSSRSVTSASGELKKIFEN